MVVSKKENKVHHRKTKKRIPAGAIWESSKKGRPGKMPPGREGAKRANDRVEKKKQKNLTSARQIRWGITMPEVYG